MGRRGWIPGVKGTSLDEILWEAVSPMVVAGLLIVLALVGVGLSGIWACRGIGLLLAQYSSILGTPLSALTTGPLVRASAGRVVPISRELTCRTESS